ncbi:MAG: hypothetical protein ACLUUO_01465 [Sellimonas intestinalis]
MGVTEPALFGVNLKYGFPLDLRYDRFLPSAAMISVGCGVEALSIGVGGSPGIIIHQAGNSGCTSFAGHGSCYRCTVCPDAVRWERRSCPRIR